MSSSGDERPWVTSAGAPAATILPGRATWMMRRGEALLAAWEAEASDEPDRERDHRPSDAPLDRTADPSPDADVRHGGAAGSEPSAAEIIAATVSGLAAPVSPSPYAAGPAAPGPARPADDVVARLRLGVDEVVEQLAAQVAGFELDLRRTGEELRGTVAEHRAEVRTVREELEAVRQWVRHEGGRLAREAALEVTHEVAEHVVRRVAEDLAPVAGGAPDRVLVDPRRLLLGVAARIGLPATHLAAVQGWASRDHRALVEVVHPGARRRLGVVAAAYGATLGHRVCVLVPRAGDAVAWRTDLTAHAPEVRVADPDAPAAQLDAADVALTSDPAATVGADLVVVADVSAHPPGPLASPTGGAAPLVLGLGGQGDATRVGAPGLAVLGPV